MPAPGIRSPGVSVSGRSLYGPARRACLEGLGFPVVLIDGLSEGFDDEAPAELEVSDATTAIASSAVQAVYDALPWRPGHQLHDPSQ
jgi:hypothetical protein